MPDFQGSSRLGSAGGAGVIIRDRRFISLDRRRSWRWRWRGGRRLGGAENRGSHLIFSQSENRGQGGYRSPVGGSRAVAFPAADR